jgi:hypothetical protein
MRLLGTWVNKDKRQGGGRIYQQAAVDALTIRSGGDWRANTWDSVGTVALKLLLRIHLQKKFAEFFY